jgi:hypothetical protein
MSNKNFNLADEFEAYDKMWEWVDKSGKNVSLNQASNANTQNSKQYYMWSMYIPNSLEYTKGDWTSAELNRKGEIDGIVFATEDLALDYGWSHLKELEDEDELGGFEPDDFTIEAIAVSGNKFGPYTDLIEWLDSKGNQVHINKPIMAKSTSSAQAAPSTSASQPPVKVTKPFKRKMVKTKFGFMIYNWQPEFIKLGLEIWNTTKKPADEKDSGAGPNILRIYFEMPNGEEWRLEVTNTKYSIANSIGVQEDWDYVISTDNKGSEVIIKRGKTKDYNEFLDHLLGLGIISDKKNCV